MNCIPLHNGEEIFFDDAGLTQPINGQIRSFDDNHRLVFSHQQSNSLELHEAGDIIFRTGPGQPPLERLRVDTNGNIGIGTGQTPAAKLEIQGDLKLKLGVAVNEFSADGTLGGNSPLAIPTEQAVKTYIDNGLTTKAALGGSAAQDFQAKNLTINGKVGIGKPNPDFQLDVNGIINAMEIFRNGAPLSTSQWTTDAGGIHYSDGNVGIGTANPGTKLEVAGAVTLGNSDIYFSKTDHDHTDIGNTPGWAAIQNAKDYDALMIQGRVGTDKERKVRLWDYLEVNGRLDVANLVRFGLDEGGSGPKVISFVRDSTDDVNAGKIAYKPSWNGGVLAIVGAGGSPRRIRMWDEVTIDGNFHYGGQLNKLDVADNFFAFVGCADFNIGHHSRRGTPGRALVDYTKVLGINWNGDWSDGCQYGVAISRQSSREYKHNIIDLSLYQASAMLQDLNPVMFSFKSDPDQMPYLGFIAEETPELIASHDHKAVNYDHIVTVLTKIVQDQVLHLRQLQEEVLLLKKEKLQRT